jgi:hypothetical protein
MQVKQTMMAGAGALQDDDCSARATSFDEWPVVVGDYT